MQPLSPEQLQAIRRMRNDGFDAGTIAIDLGVRRDVVAQAIRDGLPRLQQHKRPEYVHDVKPVRPSSAALLERLQRQAAPHRSLAGAVFGDPPVGFSALDRRGRR